jgi:hypothetical protein
VIYSSGFTLRKKKGMIEMKKLLFSVLIFAAFLIVVVLLLKGPKTEQSQVVQSPVAIDIEVDPNTMDFPEPPEDAIVFDMKYHGLNGGNDELRYNSFGSYGAQEIETPFIRALKKDVKDLYLVYNPVLGDAQWSALEMKNGRPEAFYFDLNTDGKVSENEKILPINIEETAGNKTAEFVTDDFILKTGDGNQVPFRELLRVQIYGDSPRPSCMWSPSCVLEGSTTFNKVPTKLILYAAWGSSSFKEYGSSSYSLVKSEEKTGKYLSRSSLSSIINYNGQFYNLKLYGNHKQGKMIRAVLEKYQGDTGGLVTKLAAKTALNVKLTSGSIIGSKDTTLRFNIGSGQTNLPIGEFKLDSGYMAYDTENGDQWQLNFTQGPEFVIEADKTCTMEMGEPKLTISAIDESKRYQSDVKEQTEYAKGVTILLSRKLTGKTGELYGRISQKQKSSNGYSDIKPEIKITDPDGKQIASSEMEYG